MDAIQSQIDKFGFSESLHNLEVAAQIGLTKAMDFQVSFWNDKARLNWFTHGDRNTVFFHKVTKIIYISKQLTILKKGEDILDSVVDIENHILDCYIALYASDNYCVDNLLIESVIPSVVSISDNIMLTNIPTMEEVKAVVFYLDRNNALGPDGFGGSFYNSISALLERMFSILCYNFLLKAGYIQI